MNNLADLFANLPLMGNLTYHLYCGNLISMYDWLYITSDLLIVTAFLAIPLLIIRYINRRKNAYYKKLYLLFAAFLFTCGITYLADILITWPNGYRLGTLLRFVTGILSWATVLYLVRFLPRAFKVKSSWQLTQEIEAYKTIEQQLQEANTKLKEAEMIGGFGHFEWNVVEDRITWSDSLRKLYNLPEDAHPYTLEDYIALLPREQKQKIKEELNSYITEKNYRPHYRRFTDHRGNEKIFLAQGKVVLDEQGTVIKVIGTVQDVTQLKKQEQALKQTQDKFKTIFDNAAIGMALVSTQGMFIDANKALCRMLGYERDELQLMNFQVLTYGPDLTVDLRQVERVVNGEINSYEIEKRYIKRDGSILWAILSVSRIKDENDKPHFFISQITDITYRKEQETELALSRENLMNVFRHSPIAKALINTDGTWFDVNQALCDMLGYSREELMQLTFAQIIRDTAHTTRPAFIDQLMQSPINTYRIETKYYKKDGSYVWGLSAASMVWNNQGQPVFLILQIMDVTDAKKATAG